MLGLGDTLKARVRLYPRVRVRVRPQLWLKYYATSPIHNHKFKVLISAQLQGPIYIMYGLQNQVSSYSTLPVIDHTMPFGQFLVS